VVRRSGEGSETKLVARVCESYGPVTWCLTFVLARVSLLSVCARTHALKSYACICTRAHIIGGEGGERERKEVERVRE